MIGSRRPRRRRPTHIGASLPPALKGLESKLPAGSEPEVAVIRVWDRVVGEKVAARAEPRRLLRGTLIVAVASSAWLSELSFLKNELCQRLNQALGSQSVREIRFVLADGAPAPRQRVDPPAPAPVPVDLGPFEGALADVQDPELRERIRGAIAGGLRRQARLARKS